MVQAAVGDWRLVAGARGLVLASRLCATGCSGRRCGEQQYFMCKHSLRRTRPAQRSRWRAISGHVLSDLRPKDVF
eukprot:12823316-Alexandrium_andersonii.AAC.1